MDRRSAARFLPWLLPVGFVILTFVLSTQRSPILVRDYEFDVFLKKAGHVVIYGLLALSLAFALGGSRRPERAAIGALVIATGLGVADEIHQLWTPGRSASITDVGIDAAGAVVGVIGFFALRTLRDRVTR